MPTEISPCDFIDSPEEIPKVERCYSYFCIDGKVEVKKKCINYDCGKPANDQEWVDYFDQAYLREPGFLQWPWPVPRRVREQIEQRNNETSESTPEVISFGSTLSPIQASSPIVVSSTTSKPTPTTKAPASVSQTKSPSPSTPESEFEEFRENQPKLYVPRTLNLSAPNPENLNSPRTASLRMSPIVSIHSCPKAGSPRGSRQSRLHSIST